MLHITITMTIMYVCMYVCILHLLRTNMSCKWGGKSFICMNRNVQRALRRTGGGGRGRTPRLPPPPPSKSIHGLLRGLVATVAHNNKNDDYVQRALGCAAAGPVRAI